MSKKDIDSLSKVNDPRIKIQDLCDFSNPDLWNFINPELSGKSIWLYVNNNLLAPKSFDDNVFKVILEDITLRKNH
jgi:hypothetical protein